MKCDDLETCLLEGLDDIAHNRLLKADKALNRFTKVKNYGKRNKDERCYCKELASRRVRACNKSKGATIWKNRIRK